MKIHHLTPAAALDSLDSSMEGLADTSFEGRLHAFGFNRIEESRKKSVLLAVA
ncbi:cation-transporting P-type ATPase [Methylomonas sp. MK1]|uniref:cation-transporting P-type ATPase n=1 Tax=Methylomonas sp. MK1 TaxID=1131552 RepID=UPI000364A57B|nr:cation-transporting P-type ATPase [Methylomonas sp. MK1]